MLLCSSKSYSFTSEKVVSHLSNVDFKFCIIIKDQQRVVRMIIHQFKLSMKNASKKIEKKLHETKSLFLYDMCIGNIRIYGHLHHFYQLQLRNKQKHLETFCFTDRDLLWTYCWVNPSTDNKKFLPSSVFIHHQRKSANSRETNVLRIFIKFDLLYFCRISFKIQYRHSIWRWMTGIFY